ncbi:hypothetical protein G6F31_018712 [Rhizopus arrhizus]|nr:hypothetical protein G6F31_018712 [Rhizopus arrhizus]KAG1388212.1 hypothetical protein G6F59_016060 [Rhizopus arrhizus]
MLVRPAASLDRRLPDDDRGGDPAGTPGCRTGIDIAGDDDAALEAPAVGGVRSTGVGRRAGRVAPGIERSGECAVAGRRSDAQPIPDGVAAGPVAQ